MTNETLLVELIGGPFDGQLRKVNRTRATAGITFLATRGDDVLAGKYCLRPDGNMWHEPELAGEH